MRKLLFVDDDPISHDIMESILEGGWEILSAFSGEEALECLQREFGLLVITDINMPGMNGLELLSHIRAKHPFVQVIIVSDTEESENLLKAYELGANDFIVKPFDSRDIIDTLDNTLKKVERWESAMSKIMDKRRRNGGPHPALGL